MLSAVIQTEHGYPAVPLAGQLAHQRFVLPNPLVLGKAPLNCPTPTADRDRPDSRRSKPSSRTALIRELRNPWDLLQPQDAMGRHRGAKPPRRYVRSGEISLLSPGYLLSVGDGPSTRDRRITKPCFHTCSTHPSRSQAPFCLCAHRAIANRTEGAFGLLRYLLGGDRPSQTARISMSAARLHGTALEC